MILNFAILLFIIGVLIMIGIPLFNKFEKKEPEVKRKWSDPSQRKKD